MMHKHVLDSVKQPLDSLLVAAASGRLSELIMTNPKPSLSFRLMMTSLGCVLAVLSEGVMVLPALGAWVVMVLLPYVKSLRGELCCVETEPGLRPFSGQDSPVRVGERKRRGVKDVDDVQKHSPSHLSGQQHLVRSQ